jgi:ATP-binding cassette subfamily F protein 3
VRNAPDEGTITWERGADFGFLPQESAPVGDETILHIATSGKKLEPENDDDYDIDYTLEPRAKKILAGLGFREGGPSQTGEDLLRRLGHAGAPRPAAGQ